MDKGWRGVGPTETSTRLKRQLPRQGPRNESGEGQVEQPDSGCGERAAPSESRCGDDDLSHTESDGGPSTGSQPGRPERATGRLRVGDLGSPAQQEEGDRDEVPTLQHGGAA